MRHSSIALITLALIACNGTGPTGEKVTNASTDTLVTDTSAAPAIDTSNTITLVPLTGSGVRFDGVYHYADGKLQYYMRFFERGSAAFVGGMENKPGELATLLTIDVPSGWNQVHNCPVVQRNDSLFIRSVGIRGVINYLGEVRANGDSVRFIKASEITGTRFLAPYGFIPDPASN
jgi:hypothetical protein